nr:polysaccharide pyruvyl transferase CsaB [Thalassobacillus sp. CUG 92003]
MSGYFGFQNTGDEAILSAMIHQLRAREPHIRITVLSHDMIHTTQTHDVASVNRWDLKAVMRVMKEADGLISGGGSLLQDATGRKSIVYYTGLMTLARWMKLPVFVFAQGIGPLHYRLSKHLVKHALKRTTHISVRDGESKDLLHRLGTARPVSVVPDPVMGVYPPEASSLSSNFKSPIIAVSVREWQDETRFHHHLAKSLDALVRQGYTIVFVPMHGKHDQNASAAVASLMDETSQTLPPSTEPEEKMAVIQGAKLMIGMRLHALIFAAISTVPFVALSYDPKIDSFAALCKQVVAGHVARDDWNSDTLTATIEHMLRNRSHHAYGQLVQAYRHQAHQAMDNLIRELRSKTDTNG